MSEEHIHDHDHGHDHAYMHEHGIPHSHGHVHENQKAVINRLARALGHLEKVKRMVEVNLGKFPTQGIRHKSKLCHYACEQ